MELIKFLSSTFLFAGIEYGKCCEMIESIFPELREFSRGELIFDGRKEKKLGFVVKGKCEVSVHRSDAGCVSLNNISEHGSFGILSIFSKDDYPTEIYAKKNTTCVFISEKDVLSLINLSSEIALNVIEFLAQRVSFLNARLTTFSGGSVERKLSSYLLLELKKYNENPFPFNKKHSAEAIGSGRASLYRALAGLEQSDLIKLYDKKIQIIDRIGLERLSK